MWGPNERPNWPYQRPKRAKLACNSTSEFDSPLKTSKTKKNLFLLRTSKGNTGNVKTGYQIQDFLKLDWILTTPGYPRLPQATPRLVEVLEDQWLAEAK